MPILGTIIPILGNWRVWIAAGLLFGALGTYALYERGEAAIAHLDAYKAQVEAASQQVIARNERNQSANKSRQIAAITERDFYRERLRAVLKEGNASRTVLPAAPVAAGNPDKICFARTGLDDALKQFIGEAAGIAEAGDGALIDNRAWLKSWPR